MNRRTFVTAATTLAAAGTAGCLGGDSPIGGDTPRTDDEQLAALRDEIDDRGVEYESVDLEEDIVEVEHGYDEDPNDAIANVAMAFVERIADEWDVDRLEGHLRDEGNDWAWHAEREWAQAYADGEIDPAEYGDRLSETMTMILDPDAEDEDAE